MKLDFLRKHKNQIITGLLVLLVLAAAFLWSGNVPKRGAFESPTESATESATEITEPRGTLPEKERETETATVQVNKAPAYSAETLPKEAETEKELTCTLSVKCATVLNNPDLLDGEKRELIPDGGVILPECEAVFTEGESVFDVLLRELKSRKIHLEFTNTPLYSGTYIEGINNLYEFDCGSLSGWLYKVNGDFPNYSCSKYYLKDGDSIEWLYTCDMGEDVGRKNE